MLTGHEEHLLCDEIGFEPDEFERFIEDAIDNPHQYTDPAAELQTMAKGARGLLALWRRERAEDVPAGEGNG